jgi:hypothetical protein
MGIVGLRMERGALFEAARDYIMLDGHSAG